ncbi:quinoprotein dehydrogenase-associated putative ABC transporter substrate-binding protein [Rhizobium sp. CG5]|uniref:substrate-binding domain-containing protein n=1 Tax=Rhizobium sp. CG5 TaxID=2726076 RepID=UPI002033460C|nr:substrate-binding domain-containing protein [Rhizobium sp. CG5]MCM2474209.1 quinoprotein dehydrogenase-associated putative ABC transporter substrate-binding protein [Rhizobium sp. CG5]
MRSGMLKTTVSAASWAAAIGAVMLGLSGITPALAQTSDLVSKTAFRVCADPANMPMSDRSGAGFENKIAELMAAKLGLPLEYTWFPMATGFIRKTLQANACDVVIGYAQGDELVLNTNHYYTSAFVLIVPSTGPLAGVTTLADPLLKDKRVGVVAGVPPATQMARNGLMAKAKGYHLMVDRRYEDPADDMLADLESGVIDAAVLWGPIGAPIVKASHPDLKVTPLLSEATPPRLFYRITMGVRQGEKVWERKLNSLIRRNQAEINAILMEAGVPLMNDMGTGPLEAMK